MSIEALKRKFTEIYNQESDAIFRFCLIRVSDREKALDLTQETFTKLWNHMIAKKEITNQKAFLFTIARNQIIDWYKKTKSISLESLGDEEGNPLEVEDEKSFKRIELNADINRALLLIESLSPQYREVVYLRFVEGFTPKEIAEVLGLSSNAVSIRLTRGVEALRKLLGIKK